MPRTAEDWGAVMRDPARREATHRIAGPRAVAEKLLIRIERATPHPPGSAESVRQWLLAAVRESLAWGRIEKRGSRGFTSEPSDDLRATYAAEGERFEEHLLGLTEAQLLATEPLPYRRTM